MTRATSEPQEALRETSARRDVAPVDGLPPIECPRCGYDLRGVVAVWTDACPVEGRCGECGFDFHWGKVLNPDRPPRWFVEGRERAWFAGTRTFVHSLAPWWFWKSIRMTMTVRWPLWTYPLRLAVLLLVLSCVATAVRTALTLPHGPSTDLSSKVVGVLGAGLMPWRKEPIDHVMARLAPWWVARRPGTHPGHLHFPTSSSQPIGRDATGPYFLRAITQNPASEVSRAVRRTGLRTLWPTLAACVVATAAFVALPIVRRRAKVRWIHVFRAGMYGIGLSALLVIVTWGLDLRAIHQVSSSRPVAIRWVASWSTFESRWSTTELRLFPLLLLLWWWCVARFSMRVEKPLAVALSVTIIGSIVGLTVSTILQPHAMLVPLWQFVR